MVRSRFVPQSKVKRVTAKIFITLFSIVKSNFQNKIICLKKFFFAFHHRKLDLSSLYLKYCTFWSKRFTAIPFLRKEKQFHAMGGLSIREKVYRLSDKLGLITGEDEPRAHEMDSKPQDTRDLFFSQSNRIKRAATCL